MTGLASWMMALGDAGADADLGGGAGANTPGVVVRASTIEHSQYLEIFPTSSFRVASLFTSIRRSSTMPSMLGRHSSNTLVADSNVSRWVVEEVAVASSLRSRPSNRLS